jgi:hypothetical protein
MLQRGRTSHVSDGVRIGGRTYHARSVLGLGGNAHFYGLWRGCCAICGTTLSTTPHGQSCCEWRIRGCSWRLNRTTAAPAALETQQLHHKPDGSGEERRPGTPTRCRAATWFATPKGRRSRSSTRATTPTKRCRRRYSLWTRRGGSPSTSRSCRSCLGRTSANEQEAPCNGGADRRAAAHATSARAAPKRGPAAGSPPDRGKRGAMRREPLTGNRGENFESHKPVHETTTGS